MVIMLIKHIRRKPLLRCQNCGVQYFFSLKKFFLKVLSYRCDNCREKLEYPYRYRFIKWLIGIFNTLLFLLLLAGLYFGFVRVQQNWLFSTMRITAREGVYSENVKMDNLPGVDTWCWRYYTGRRRQLVIEKNESLRTTQNWIEYFPIREIMTPIGVRISYLYDDENRLKFIRMKDKDGHLLYRLQYTWQKDDLYTTVNIQDEEGYGVEYCYRDRISAEGFWPFDLLFREITYFCPEGVLGRSVYFRNDKNFPVQITHQKPINPGKEESFRSLEYHYPETGLANWILEEDTLSSYRRKRIKEDDKDKTIIVSERGEFRDEYLFMDDFKQVTTFSSDGEMVNQTSYEFLRELPNTTLISGLLKNGKTLLTLEYDEKGRMVRRYYGGINSQRYDDFIYGERSFITKIRRVDDQSVKTWRLFYNQPGNLVAKYKEGTGVVRFYLYQEYFLFQSELIAEFIGKYSENRWEWKLDRKYLISSPQEGVPAVMGSAVFYSHTVGEPRNFYFFQANNRPSDIMSETSQIDRSLEELLYQTFEKGRSIHYPDFRRLEAGLDLSVLGGQLWYEPLTGQPLVPTGIRNKIKFSDIHPLFSPAGLILLLLVLAVLGVISTYLSYRYDRYVLEKFNG